jgi:hypothetical protein
MNSQLSDVAASPQFDFDANGFGNWNGSTFAYSAGGNDSVAIYGYGTIGDGSDISSAIPLNVLASVATTDQTAGGDATNGYIPTAPVPGVIGANTDGALGDQAHVKLRTYIPAAASSGGQIQFEWVIVYTFTA